MFDVECSMFPEQRRTTQKCAERFNQSQRFPEVTMKTRVQSERHVPAKSGKVAEVTRSRRERSFELLLQERSALQEVVGELEASRQHYADLFDLAPMGYLSLDRNGCIREINLTGAAMLGRKRTHLL